MVIESVFSENDKLIDEADEALIAVAEFALLIRPEVDGAADPTSRQPTLQTLLDDLLEVRARLITQQAYLEAGRKLHS